MREDTCRRAIGPDAGAQVRAARRRAGLSLRGAARRIGIGHGYLGLIEAGERSPASPVAERLIDALALDPATVAHLRDEAEAVDEGRERRAREREGARRPTGLLHNGLTKAHDAAD